MRTSIRCPNCRAAHEPSADPVATTFTCSRCRHTFRPEAAEPVGPDAPLEVLPADDVLDSDVGTRRHYSTDIPEVLPADGPDSPGPKPAWHGERTDRLAARVRRTTEGLGEVRVPDAVWWNAQFRDGLSIQYGRAVLRPDYFAFLPTGERSHLLLAFLGKLVTSSLGAEEFPRSDPRYAHRFPFEDLVRRGAESFDSAVAEGVRRSGGFIWERGSASLSREANPVWSRWDMLVFQSGRCLVRGIPPRKQNDAAKQMVGRWAGGRDLPVRHPLVLWTLVTLWPTATAAVMLATWFRDPGSASGDTGSAAGLVCGTMFALLAAPLCFFTLRAYVRALQRPRR